MVDKLDLHKVKSNRWHVQAAIASRGDGIYEGMDWLSKNLDLK